MARSKGKIAKPPFYWRYMLLKATLVLLVLAICAEVAFIWFKGNEETEDAFASGRRLLINLSDDSIEGKVISSTPTEEKKEEEKKEESKENTEPAKTETAENTEKTTEAAETKPEEVKPVEEVVSTLDTIKEEAEVELPSLLPSKNPTAEFSSKLSEKTEFGTLPKISSDGTKPWKYYSKQVTVKDKKPIIAIIVTGLGKNKYVSELALRLPEEINLSFSPYSKDISSWMASARVSGHEVLIDLPMESANYPVSDPGPLGLLVSKEQGENETKLKKLMGQKAGFVGFLSPFDEAFIEHNELLKSFLQVLAGRGLMLVVGKQPPKNETKEILETSNAANVIVDNLVDEELTENAIQARLVLMEQTAKQRGYAVGVANAYPLTIKQLEKWAAKKDENGFQLVPVSVIVSKRF